MIQPLLPRKENSLAMSDTNLYAAPKAVVDKPVDGYVPAFGWKLFFFIHVLFVALTPVMFFVEMELSILDYVDHALFWVSAVGVFGMAFQKRVLHVRFWQAMIPVSILWFIFYFFGAPIVFEAEHYGEAVVYDWWLFLDAGTIALTCFAFYLYTMKMPQVWNADRSGRA